MTTAEPSGPRAASRIRQSAREVLAERGYADLTVEAVAAKAGVGKSTIYRWWPNREALLADALAEIFKGDEIPDLGDTQAELRLAVDMTIDNYADADLAIAVPALAADLARSPELLASFRETFLLRKRDNIAVALRRGIDRGDLPAALDTGLVQDLWAGTILYRRLLSGSPLDDQLAERLVRLVFDASATLSS
ncbi:TetR/AcrR family transcriptional regulator [Nonomuraea guangzhouensis]|uniref:TetR/AcrR family transcriptional regulator n=1 Tax=Nonomuraea guangzhouensis TaxID=1291555 RepID=A0ABW4GWM0_9ACTN